jgi:hypothetical protein
MIVKAGVEPASIGALPIGLRALWLLIQNIHRKTIP